TRQEQKPDLPADGSPVKIPIAFKPTRFGLHEATFAITTGGEAANFRRNFVYFHPDTREQTPWQEGRGSIFGFWPWGGGHVTPPSDKEISVMAAAGAETSTANYSLSPPDIQALAQKHRFIGESAFFGGIMYFNGFYEWYSGAPKFNAAKPD